MRYLHRQAKRRKNPRINVPEALAVVVVLENYYAPDTAADLEAPRVAKYARGQDYHRVTRARVDRLGEFLLERGARVVHSYVDDGPVPERALAYNAGLGWIGKNTMLIRPGVGSFFFIGTIFTDLPLPVTRRSPPTTAAPAPAVSTPAPRGRWSSPMCSTPPGASRISRSSRRAAIPTELAARLDGWAFGCDICNDVCPWNHRFATTTAVAELLPVRPLAGADVTLFDTMDDEEFLRRYGGTPFERPGLRGMRRNVRAALASTHREEPEA